MDASMSVPSSNSTAIQTPSSAGEAILWGEDFWGTFSIVQSVVYAIFVTIACTVFYLRRHIWPLRARSISTIIFFSFGCVVSHTGMLLSLLPLPDGAGLSGDVRRLTVSQSNHNVVTYCGYMLVFVMFGNVYYVRLLRLVMRWRRLKSWQKQEEASIKSIAARVRAGRRDSSAANSSSKGPSRTRSRAGSTSKKRRRKSQEVKDEPFAVPRGLSLDESGGVPEARKDKESKFWKLFNWCMNHMATTLLIGGVLEYALFIAIFAAGFGVTALVDPMHEPSGTRLIMISVLFAGYVTPSLVLVWFLRSLSDGTFVRRETLITAGIIVADFVLFYIILFSVPSFPTRWISSLIFWPCFYISVVHPIHQSSEGVRKRLVEKAADRQLKLKRRAAQVARQNLKRRDRKLAKRTKANKKDNAKSHTANIGTIEEGATPRAEPEKGSEDYLVKKHAENAAALGHERRKFQRDSLNPVLGLRTMSEASEDGSYTEGGTAQGSSIGDDSSVARLRRLADENFSDASGMGELNFDAVVDDEDLLVAAQEYMVSTLEVQHLFFLLDVSMFKSSNEEDRIDAALDVYNKYVSPTKSLNAIEVSGSTKRKLINAIDAIENPKGGHGMRARTLAIFDRSDDIQVSVRSQTPPTTLFDAAEAEVLELVNTNILPRFSQSGFYFDYYQRKMGVGSDFDMDLDLQSDEAFSDTSSKYASVAGILDESGFDNQYDELPKELKDNLQESESQASSPAVGSKLEVPQVVSPRKSKKSPRKSKKSPRNHSKTPRTPRKSSKTPR